jgi:hypothetical protein
MSDDSDARLQRLISNEERGTWREALRADFAPWFDDLFWGLQCGDGWRDIICRLTAEIACIVGGPDAAPQIRIVQVKEKLGTLRYYVQDVPEVHRAAVNAAIWQAEERSAATCEACGGPGRLRETEEGYWYTACDSHALA